jgi:hypothetical protein
VKQHGTSHLHDISDGSLSYTILEVSVHTTVRYCLIVLLTVLLERIVCKSAIVCMIVLDGYTVFGCKSFKRLLCLDGFLQ